jgi:hypothetical protein
VASTTLYGDEKTPYFVEDLHSGDGIKVTRREGVVSLAFMASFSSGMA